MGEMGKFIRPISCDLGWFGGKCAGTLMLNRQIFQMLWILLAEERKRLKEMDLAYKV